jgi:hypothetical protein
MGIARDGGAGFQQRRHLLQFGYNLRNGGVGFW